MADESYGYPLSLFNREDITGTLFFPDLYTPFISWESEYLVLAIT